LTLNLPFHCTKNNSLSLKKPETEGIVRRILPFVTKQVMWTPTLHKSSAQKCYARSISGHPETLFHVQDLTVALLETKEVLKLLEQKPGSVELILTGRYCPWELIDKADLVTEMREIKHYYQKGILARKGIESCQYRRMNES
jgi:hypothetical protein